MNSEPKAEAVPGIGAPVGFADPFRTVNSGIQGLATVATPAIDSWPSSLQFSNMATIQAALLTVCHRNLFQSLESDQLTRYGLDCGSQSTTIIFSLSWITNYNTLSVVCQ
ncbi:hypothetical protein O6H91_05G104800 [Diphasiastrum complanatum]|uniref:Uncharacterized protein n=1 Tax=Diphasiastrum complanatum TaxID=34168 RepID=A0ACC2DS19_DIPCM|nr:hypothetical protein O6H91_05G104800 [Diphasiastrum complanatum]